MGWRQFGFLIYTIFACAGSFALALWTLKGIEGAGLGPLIDPLFALVFGVYVACLIGIPYHYYLRRWLIRERVGKLLKRARRHIAAGRVDRLDALLAKAKSLDKECGGCASEQIRQLEAELYLHVRNA